jgi:thiol-disulfide isomerase/thioredoxin
MLFVQKWTESTSITGMKLFLWTTLLVACLPFSLLCQTYLEEAVDFTVTDIDGTEHRLFEYLEEDKFVVIDFFYTTCNPCIGSIPTLNFSFEKYGCNKGDLIFLSVNFNDTNTELLEYRNTYNNLAPLVSGTEGNGNEVIIKYGIFAFPTVILIAPDGKIINQDIYPVTQENMNYALEQQAGLSNNEEACFISTVNAVFDPPSLLSSIQIYPVPAERELTLAGEAAETGSLQIRLTDLQGRALLQTETRIAAGSFSSPLNLPELSGGFYFLELSFNHKSEITRLINVK